MIGFCFLNRSITGKRTLPSGEVQTLILGFMSTYWGRRGCRMDRATTDRSIPHILLPPPPFGQYIKLSRTLSLGIPTRLHNRQDRGEKSRLRKSRTDLASTYTIRTVPRADEQMASDDRCCRIFPNPPFQLELPHTVQPRQFYPGNR